MEVLSAKGLTEMGKCQKTAHTVLVWSFCFHWAFFFDLCGSFWLRVLVAGANLGDVRWFGYLALLEANLQPTGVGVKPQKEAKMRKFQISVLDAINAIVTIKDSGFNCVDLQKIGENYQYIAEQTKKSTGIYVDAIQLPCKVLYSAKWGCPKGGENAIRIEAICNPMYSLVPAREYINAWKDALIKNIQSLMDELDAMTASVAYSDGEIIYVQKFSDADDI